MRLHDTLRWLPARYRQFQSQLDSFAVAGDGGFSRVYLLNHYLALKVTTCKATRTLLTHLLERPLPGLPGVYKSLGPVATDADGFQFHGFVIERLFRPDELKAMQKARLAGRADGYLTGPTPGVAPDALERLHELLATENERLFSGPRRPGPHGQTVAVDYFERCAAFGPVHYSEAFRLLARLAKAHGYRADLLLASNVLLDCFGRPVLADPIAESWAIDLDPEDESTADELNEAARPVQLVLQLEHQTGHEVHLRWHVLESGTAPANPSLVVEARPALWGDASHQELAGQTIVLPYWKMPRSVLDALAAARRQAS